MVFALGLFHIAGSVNINSVEMVSQQHNQEVFEALDEFEPSSTNGPRIEKNLNVWSVFRGFRSITTEIVDLGDPETFGSSLRTERKPVNAALDRTAFDDKKTPDDYISNEVFTSVPPTGNIIATERSWSIWALRKHAVTSQSQQSTPRDRKRLSKFSTDNGGPSDSIEFPVANGDTVENIATSSEDIVTSTEEITTSGAEITTSAQEKTTSGEEIINSGNQTIVRMISRKNHVLKAHDGRLSTSGPRIARPVSIWSVFSGARATTRG